MLYPRDILIEIKKIINRDEFIILTGARQTGKTSLLILIKNLLEEKGEDCHYFNLENIEYLKLLNKNPLNIFELIPISKSKQNIFIDEVQYLDNPTNFLKLLYDEKKEKVKVIASGSSSFYIDRKFRDSLVGRKFLFEVSTLNFNEFLIFNDEEAFLKQGGEKLTIYYRNRLLELWEKYVIYGSYPKIALEKKDGIKKILLEEIGTSYTKKDVIDAGIKNTEKYFLLLKILANQTGQLVNSQELANTLSTSHATIKEYLYVMRKSYQIAFITPFYRNLRKELTKMPKVYFYDSGLRNFYLNNYNSIEKRSDKGSFTENIIFRELLNNVKDPTKIKFWRTQDKKEVDFVLPKEAYEVKYEPAKIRERRYLEFRKEYPEIKFNYISYDKILEKFYGW